MTQNTKEPVFGDVPAPILGLCGIIIALSTLVLVGPVTVSNWIMGAMAVQIGDTRFQQPLGPWPPYILHAFVHGGWLHLGMNMLGLLAFGSPIARWLVHGVGATSGAIRFFMVFFICTFAGALTEVVAIEITQAPGATLVGASGGLMGLIGVLIRLEYGRRITPLPLFSRAVMTALIPWIALNLIIAVFGMPGVSSAIAWPAHLGGLFAGVLLAGVIAPRR